MKIFHRLLLIFLLFSCRAISQMPVEDELFGFVIGIEGKSREGRSEFIKNQLTKMGVGFFTVPFEYYNYRVKDTIDLSGEDIVVRIGDGKKRFVVGAHFDAWEGSPGANDNGSGVAVLLELVKELKKQPMKCTVDLCFFDQEEQGLLGSQFYIQRVVDRKDHYGMINLDVEGTGEEVFVGPVGGGDDEFLMPLVRKTARQTQLPYQERAFYPNSDHVAFVNAKLENISISVVPKGDSELLSKMMKGGGRLDPKNPPKVMRVMHTPNDRSSEMTPGALKMSFTFTRTLLQLVNDSIK
jgi:hypothetical protein